MTETQNASSRPVSGHPAEPAPPGRWYRLVLPLLILIGALAVFVIMRATAPQAPQRPRPAVARRVHVYVARRTTVRTVLDQLQGRVLPAREVTVSPEVAGVVTDRSEDLIPGGVIRGGQVLLQIDRREYELMLQQRQDDVARAQLNLALERGKQVVARQEFDLLGQEVSTEERALVLREPHLAEAEAALVAAEAALRKAQLDCERCCLRAPFNAVVRSRNVDVGTRVSPGMTVATLAGIDAFWVQVAVPAGKLHWIEIPEDPTGRGSTVVLRDPVTWGPGRTRTGTVIRLLSDIEPEGLMARLLVRVEDPLARRPQNAGAPVMLLGSLVDVEIQGRTIESVVPLDRTLLRDGDQVWLADANDTLQFRPVTVVFRGRDRICVSEGLETGDRVVVTQLGAPVAGMPLEVVTEPNVPATVQAADPTEAEASR